jgi:predicted PurR-regulated permease PerM
MSSIKTPRAKVQAALGVFIYQMSMMLPDLPEFQEEESQDTRKYDFTEQFIEDYIRTQKAKLETRKLIEEFLFFASCQVASASLALILFQFAVQTVFTVWMCLFVAWTPSLSSLTEVNFQKNEDGWTLRIMNRPITTLIKFVSSVGVVTLTIYSIANDLQATVEQINAVYTEIQQYEHPKIEHFLPPYFIPIVLASVAIVLLFGFVKAVRDRNPF